MKEYRKKFKDPWESLEVLNACPYCEGALYILGPCPVHGSSPLNSYLWRKNLENMPEWECSRCHERGRSNEGNVPYTHYCPDQKRLTMDLSTYHTLS